MNKETFEKAKALQEEKNSLDIIRNKLNEDKPMHERLIYYFENHHNKEIKTELATIAYEVIMQCLLNKTKIIEAEFEKL